MFVYQRVGDTCCLAPYFLVVQMRLRRYGYSYFGRVVACCCRIVKTTKWDDAWIWKTACNWIATSFLFAICNGVTVTISYEAFTSYFGPIQGGKSTNFNQADMKKGHNRQLGPIYGFMDFPVLSQDGSGSISTLELSWALRLAKKNGVKFGKMVTWVIAANRFVMWCCMSINAYSILHVYYIYTCLCVYIYYTYIYILYYIYLFKYIIHIYIYYTYIYA